MLCIYKDMQVKYGLVSQLLGGHYWEFSHRRILNTDININQNVLSV